MLSRSREAPKKQMKMAKMSSKSALRSASFFDDDDFDAYQARDQVINKQNFEELEATSEYMENHYYKETDNKN